MWHCCSSYYSGLQYIRIYINGSCLILEDWQRVVTPCYRGFLRKVQFHQTYPNPQTLMLPIRLLCNVCDTVVFWAFQQTLVRPFCLLSCLSACLSIYLVYLSLSVLVCHGLFVCPSAGRSLSAYLAALSVTRDRGEGALVDEQYRYSQIHNVNAPDRRAHHPSLTVHHKIHLAYSNKFELL